MKDEIRTDKLLDIVSESLGIPRDSVTLKSNFYDELDADSLDLIDILQKAESELGIKVDPSSLESIKTVGDLALAGVVQ